MTIKELCKKHINCAVCPYLPICGDRPESYKLGDDLEVTNAIIETAKELEQEPSEDCVSRKFMYELGATCIATRDKNNKLIALGTIENLPPVQPILTIPENPTNGDVLKAMFPDASVLTETDMIVVVDIDRSTHFSKDWWDAPWKKGNDEESIN